MGYTAEERTTAITIMHRQGGMTYEAIAAIESALGRKPSKSTLSAWWNSDTEPTSRTEPNRTPKQTKGDDEAENGPNLTDKQRLFVEYYIQCLNATEAAALAGYEGDYNSLRVIGSTNLAKVNIRAAIDQRLKEYHLSADEVLSGLSDIARASIADFVNPSGYIDLVEADKRGKLHMARKIKRTVRRDKDGGETETIEIELYDKQAALLQLGRYHQLFVDRMKIDDWRSQAIADIRAGHIKYQPLAEAFDDDLATELFKAAGVPVPA